MSLTFPSSSRLGLDQISLTRLSTTRWAASLFLALALASLGCQGGVEFKGTAVEPPKPAGKLVGTNWNGERFSLDQLQGKVAMVFFGYTFCPDVCPFTLAKMKQVYDELGDEAKDFAVVFVSVDSQRDTVEKLADYVPGFDPRFYGLRLEPDELEQAVDSFDLTVQIGQPKDGPNTDSFYYVDHTGTYFLIDRQGRLRVTHPPNAKVENLLPDIEALLES